MRKYEQPSLYNSAWGGDHFIIRRVILQDVVSLQAHLHYLKQNIENIEEIFSALLSTIETPQWPVQRASIPQPRTAQQKNKDTRKCSQNLTCNVSLHSRIDCTSDIPSEIEAEGTVPKRKKEALKHLASIFECYKL